MTQLVTRIDDDLAAAIDRLVAEGVVPSRSAAVRLGLRYLIDRERRASIGREIVEGYTAMPQSDDELVRSDDATVAMISEESW